MSIYRQMQNKRKYELKIPTMSIEKWYSDWNEIYLMSFEVSECFLCISWYMYMYANILFLLQTRLRFCVYILFYILFLFCFSHSIIVKRLWFLVRDEKMNQKRMMRKNLSFFYDCISLWWIFSHGEIGIFER